MRSSQRWTKASDWELAPLSPCLSRRFNKVIFCRMIPLLKTAFKSWFLFQKLLNCLAQRLALASNHSPQLKPSLEHLKQIIQSKISVCGRFITRTVGRATTSNLFRAFATLSTRSQNGFQNQRFLNCSKHTPPPTCRHQHKE